MTEKKCKICGDWINSKKIAMHYWNIHHKKYNEYKDNEETREVEDVPVVGDTNAKTTCEKENIEETTTIETTGTTGTTETIQQETRTEEIITEETKVEEPQIPEANPWLETVKYFEGPVTNETRHEVRKVVKHDLTDEGQTLNEWC